MILSYGKLPYRQCVVMVLVKDGKIFTGERLDAPNSWQLPQGGVEKDETWEQAAFRELYEETGVKSAEFILETKNTYKYDFPEGVQRKMQLRLGHEPTYRGQEQKFCVFKFFGSESEINLRIMTQEFENYQWMPVEKVLNIIVDFKKNTYISAFQDLQKEEKFQELFK